MNITTDDLSEIVGWSGGAIFYGCSNYSNNTYVYSKKYNRYIIWITSIMANR